MTMWRFVAYAMEPTLPDEPPPTCRFEWETPATITAVAVHVAAIIGALLGGVRWRKPGLPTTDETSH